MSKDQPKLMTGTNLINTDTDGVASVEQAQKSERVVFFDPALSESASNAANEGDKLSAAPASNYNQRKRAAEYIKRGWWPIPLQFMGEEPIPSNWQKLYLQLKDIDQWFPPDENRNVGIKLGDFVEPIVVVDIVDEDALPFAASYLPQTMVFGRASRRKSHRVYRTPQAEYKCDVVEPRNFFACGGIILKVLGEGPLAVFPDSMHESGEMLTFENGRDFSSMPKLVAKYELEIGIDMVLIATVLFKITGDRRSLALNAARCLLSTGWTQGAVEHLITLVAKQAGDGDIDSHLSAIQSAMGAIYKAGRSGLVACMGVEGVADIEASLRNIDEWRDTLYLDTLRCNFAPSKGFPRGRHFPPLAS
jgi:hypothetical protein